MKTEKAKTKNSQREKFIEKAREIGADEDERAFDEKLKRLTKPPRKIKKRSND